MLAGRIRNHITRDKQFGSPDFLYPGDEVFYAEHEDSIEEIKKQDSLQFGAETIHFFITQELEQLRHSYEGRKRLLADAKQRLSE